MSKTNEWDLLKHQFETLVQDEGVDPDSIEKVLDGQVRRRFAELINRAADPSKQNSEHRPVPPRFVRAIPEGGR
ncbi:MAG: hypothetical protein WCF47_23845 [Pseudolabrys sp.]